jgi:hypothetical protein
MSRGSLKEALYVWREASLGGWLYFSISRVFPKREN